MDVEALKAKLDAKVVSTRKQGGVDVPYIEAWWAIAEANRIFGHDGWTRATIDMDCVIERERAIGRDRKPGWGVTYRAKVRVVVGEVVREGTGAGHGIGADLGEAHESAMKEAESDAMKRALMTFGHPFGLALYDKSRAFVDFHAQAQSAPHTGESPSPEGEAQKPGEAAQSPAQRLREDAKAFYLEVRELPARERKEHIEAHGGLMTNLRKHLPDAAQSIEALAQEAA